MAMTIPSLMEERAHKIKTLRDMKEKAQKEEDRNFTPAESDDIDALKKDVAELDTKIQERELHEARLDTIDTYVETLTKPDPPLRRRLTVPQDPESGLEGDGSRRINYPRMHKRSMKLRAFPDEDMAFRCGRWLQAQLKGESAMRWCVANDIETRAMSEGINTAGGVLVPDEMSQRLIDLRESHGIFRQHAYIEPMAGDTKDIRRQTGGQTAYFSGEGESTTESDPSYDLVGLVAKKIHTETRVSSELEEDSAIDIAEKFVSDAAKAFALKEDQCGFNGTGTSTFGGIHGLTEKIVDSDHTASVVTVATIDRFDEITLTHLNEVMGLLPEFAAGEAAWYCSRVCWAMVFQRLAQAGGGNTIETIGGDRVRSFAGYPIIISQVLPTSTGALNAKAMFLFGDLKMAATLGDRRGVRLAQSEHKHWSTDEIALRATERIDIISHDLGDTSDAGPMVAFKGTT